MSLISSGQKLLVVTEKGYGKRSPLKSYKIQARGGKGIMTYDKAKFDKTGMMVGGVAVDDDDEIMLINSDGVIIRIKASDVSVMGRATQGVKIMRVDDDATIVAMAKVIKEDEEDDEPKVGEQLDLLK